MTTESSSPSQSRLQNLCPLYVYSTEDTCPLLSLVLTRKDGCVQQQQLRFSPPPAKTVFLSPKSKQELSTSVKDLSQNSHDLIPSYCGSFTFLYLEGSLFQSPSRKEPPVLKKSLFSNVSVNFKLKESLCLFCSLACVKP